MEHIHLIGIGGTGLSAIAYILLEKGYKVSGSDRVKSDQIDLLSDMGAKIFIGHQAENISEADTVVRSSAILDTNPEVTAARKANIPVLKRSDFLRRLLAGKRVLAISGTHGKTTTTAMIAWILSEEGKDPSFIIGGISQNLGKNAQSGSGDYFVIEADEYDRMFLGLDPDGLLVTNLEHDHPDCFPTVEDYFDAFTSLIKLIKPNGFLILNKDDSNAYQLADNAPKNIQVVSYGFNSGADYTIEDARLNIHGAYDFTLMKNKGNTKEMIAEVSLGIPGKHNLSNAAGALAMLDQFNLPIQRAARALGEFSGTGRRFEIHSEIEGVVIISDYGHHPTEIKTTLLATRDKFPMHQIWAVWQPHTYSRTKLLQAQFLSAFSSADHMIMTDVYASRENVEPFSYESFLADMDQKDARHISGLDNAANYLANHLNSNDVLIVFSAGDADQVCQKVYERLATKVKSRRE